LRLGSPWFHSLAAEASMLDSSGAAKVTASDADSREPNSRDAAFRPSGIEKSSISFAALCRVPDQALPLAVN
jgi:hypothetical protein